MSLSWLRARSVPALLSLGVLSVALSVAGCKQSDGERCEIDSDCASGICGPNGTASTMTSSAGLRCVAMIGSTLPVDAGGGSDAALPPVDGAATDVGGDAGDAATDAGSDAHDAAVQPDGGSDGAGGSDGGGADAAHDTGSDAAPSADGATDAGTDGAAAGG